MEHRNFEQHESAEARLCKADKRTHSNDSQCPSLEHAYRLWDNALFRLSQHLQVERECGHASDGFHEECLNCKLCSLHVLLKAASDVSKRSLLFHAMLSVLKQSHALGMRDLHLFIDKKARTFQGCSNSKRSTLLYVYWTMLLGERPFVSENMVVFEMASRLLDNTHKHPACQHTIRLSNGHGNQEGKLCINPLHYSAQMSKKHDSLLVWKDELLRCPNLARVFAERLTMTTLEDIRTDESSILMFAEDFSLQQIASDVKHVQIERRNRKKSLSPVSPASPESGTHKRRGTQRKQRHPETRDSKSKRASHEQASPMSSLSGSEKELCSGSSYFQPHHPAAPLYDMCAQQQQPLVQQETVHSQDMTIQNGEYPQQHYGYPSPFECNPFPPLLSQSAPIVPVCESSRLSPESFPCQYGKAQSQFSSFLRSQHARHERSSRHEPSAREPSICLQSAPSPVNSSLLYTPHSSFSQQPSQSLVYPQSSQQSAHSHPSLHCSFESDYHQHQSQPPRQGPFVEQGLLNPFRDNQHKSEKILRFETSQLQMRPQCAEECRCVSRIACTSHYADTADSNYGFWNTTAPPSDQEKWLNNQSQ